MRSVDVILAGGNGQIGSALLDEFRARQWTVHRLNRGDSFSSLPPADHVVNAAGYTRFDKNIEKYWYDNVRFAAELALVAREMGARFHQLSSEAVAEFRGVWPSNAAQVLTETSKLPSVHPNMIDYAASKVLVELSVKAAYPDAYIYRTSDVVPDPGRFWEQWRRNHWLTILFSAGQEGFKYRDSFPVWVAPVGDIASGIATLVEARLPGSHRHFHLLGQRYLWWEFVSALPDDYLSPRGRQGVAKIAREVVRIDPPLAECITQDQTVEILLDLGHKYSLLGADYWEEYARMSIMPIKKGQP